MEAVALDPGDYTGTYKLIGGRMALDLVNTISWPDTDCRHDWFDPPTNVTAWLMAVGLDRLPVKRSDLAVIIEIRDVISGVLRPLVNGDRPPPNVMGHFNELLAGASSRRFIDPNSLNWVWPSPRRASDAFDPALFDAAELLAAGTYDRVKQCPSCHWLFRDQTRNGRRRWCDMADCGSRAKARTYYRRTKAEPSSPNN
jgi:predicted RNA-binding Zn ribbon-like protein